MAKGKGATIKYGTSGYKGARNVKTFPKKSLRSKGTPTLKKGGRVKV